MPKIVDNPKYLQVYNYHYASVEKFQYSDLLKY